MKVLAPESSSAYCNTYAYLNYSTRLEILTRSESNVSELRCSSANKMLHYIIALCPKSRIVFVHQRHLGQKSVLSLISRILLV